MITKPLTQFLKGTPFQWTLTSQATFDVSSSLATNILNTKLVLSLLEILEQFRLSWTSSGKLISLLHQQKLYWKQRGIIKWVELGEEDIEFFHANATIKLRKTLITSLKDESAIEYFQHQSKVKLLWNLQRKLDGFTNEFIKKCWHIIVQSVLASLMIFIKCTFI
jgi:hypothetical protein